MPGYTCSKCGSTGHSKNNQTRNFFLSNQFAAWLSNMVKVTTVRHECVRHDGERLPDLDGYDVTFHVRVYDDSLKRDGKPVADDEAEIYAFETMQLNENHLQTCYKASVAQTIREWLCNHKYVADGEPTC